MKKGRFIGTKISKYIASGVLLFSMFSFLGCDKKEDTTASEIESLKEQIAAIQSQNDELSKQLADLQAQSQALIDAKNQEIAAKTSEIESLSSQIETLTSSVTSLNTLINNLSSQIKTLEGDNTELQEQLADLQAQKEVLEGQITTLSNNLATANQQITQLQAEKEALEEELESLTKFTVTFDSNGGSAVPSQKYIPNATIDKPANPTRKGYSFIKWVHGSGSEEWDFEHDVIIGNMTLVAVWSANQYTLTYNRAGGYFDPAHSNSDLITYDTNFTLPTVKKASNVFVRWEDNGKEFKAGKWTYDKNITITAVWAKATSTITYDFGYEGKAAEYQNVAYNSNFELQTPERVGYTFTGWTYQNKPISSGKYTYLDDITVVATWSANKYIFNLSDEEGLYSGDPTFEVTFDQEFDLPVCPSLSEDRPFAGWFEGTTRISDENGHCLAPWTRTDGAELVAKYFHPISTKDDFLNIKDNPSTIYSLVNDVDFNGEEINPLDTFEGELWGMGYSIKNVLFNSDSTLIGLFKQINNAKFSNLGFKNCIINIEGEQIGNVYYAGLLAAQAFGSNEFENVTYSDISLYVDAPESKVIMGGLIGKGENLVINDVTSGGVVEAKSTGNSVNLGGFIGECVGHIDAYNYINGADVRGYSLGGEHDTTHALCEGNVGGLVGLSNTSYLEDSYNNGVVKEDSVKKTDSYAGGLIGKNNGRPEFNNSYNKGEVKGSSYVGGVLGCSALKGSFAISKIHNEGEVSDLGDTAYLGGVIGRCLVDTLVSQVYNSGEIVSSNGVAGGLIGAGDSIITLQESYNDGNITSANGSAGGLIGSSKTSKLWDCYNLGIVTAKSYVGGLIAINAFPSTSISNSYVGGTLTLTADSLDGRVGAFIGKSASTTIGSSFVFATLIGLEDYTNSFVGQFESGGGTADNVVSAATVKDLDDNVISEPATQVLLVSLETITSEYISSTLMFNSAKWIIEFDVSESLYPTLKCFEI